MTELPVLHASLGASSSHRWMECPGSVALTRGVPDVESPFALEGTAAHAVLEQSLALGMDSAMFLGSSIEGVRVDEEMVEAVQVAVDYVRSRMALPAFRSMMLEQSVNLDPLGPPAPMFGTADVVLLFDGFMEVVDYKHGTGVFVSEQDNSQLLFYALGSLLTVVPAEEEVSPVVMTVVQPRIPSARGPVRSEVISVPDLLAWGMGELIPSAEQAMAPNAPRIPGEKQCRFCRAKHVCPELREESMEMARGDFDALPAPESLDPAMLSDILKKGDLLEIWMNAVRSHAHALASHGVDVPGWKLVEKRATKRWRDEEPVLSVAELLGYSLDEVAPRKLLTPAQLETKTGVSWAEHYAKESSGTNLVPADDPRPEVSESPRDEFTAIQKDEA